MATYTITVTKTPIEAAGIIKVGSSLANGNVQEEGVTVNALASPASGYFFVSWEIDSVVVSTSSAYSFVMPSNDIILTANFEATPTPSTDEQPEIYDTDCPRFFFVSNLNDRFFTGDVVNLTVYTYQEVNEPISFDTGMFKLERDLNYHGFNYEFGVDELQYELGSEGFTYLRTQLLTGGTDSDIKFVYGFGQPDALTIFYIGKVDFNEYKEVDNGEKVSFSLVELDFDNLLQTAFEVAQEVELADTVRMYSKVLPKRVEYKVEVPPTEIGVFTFPYRAWFADAYRTPDPPNPDIEAISKADPVGYIHFNDGRIGDNDFELFATYDFQLDDLVPTDVEKYVLVAKEAGTYNIDIKFWLGMRFVLPANFTDLSFLELTFLHTAKDGTTTIDTDTFTPNETIVPTGLTDPDKIAVFTQSVNYNLGVDEYLYIYIRVNTGSASFPASGSITSLEPYPYEYDYSIPHIAIVGHTQADSSNCKITKSYNALNSVCKQATEVSYDIVKSDFFNGGCGELLHLTNGFNIRNVNKNLKVAPKKLIDMLKNLYNLGWGVEYNEVKQELVAIEPVEYFYQDVNILNLDSISDYQKEIDSSLIYNEIEVGFSKYSKQRETDKGFTLDDFHTKHTYQTPIKTNKSKLSIISDLVLSAYEIEILRRKQFVKTGDKASSNFNEDEEVFGLQLTGDTATETYVYDNSVVTFEEGGTTIITGQFPFVLIVGEEVSYTSRAGETLTRIVTYFNVSSYDILGTIYYQTYIGFNNNLTGATTGAGDVTITKSVAGNLLVPEGAEPFDTIENLLSPATTYNLRYTPKRILYNWAKLFAGSFFTKTGTDQVVFKQGDGNVELVTQFSASESCLLGDVNRSVITEGGNVNISELGGRSYLFLPIKVSFSTSLSFEQLTDLKKCLRGQDGTRDYGYVTITSPCGDAEKIFITSVEYSGVTEEAKIEGYLKEITGIE